MKILGKKKNKLVNVDKIEIALTIKELETLRKFTIIIFKIFQTASNTILVMQAI